MHRRSEGAKMSVFVYQVALIVVGGLAIAATILATAATLRLAKAKLDKTK